MITGFLHAITESLPLPHVLSLHVYGVVCITIVYSHTELQKATPTFLNVEPACLLLADSSGSDTAILVSMHIDVGPVTSISSVIKVIKLINGYFSW